MDSVNKKPSGFSMITSPFSQSLQRLSRVRVSVTPRTAARRASFEPTNSSPLSQRCRPAVSSSVVPCLLGFLIYLGHLAADEIALVVWIPSLKVKHLPALHACWVALVMLDSLQPYGLYPPGSSVHGILQARTLEWVAVPSSRGSSWPRDWTCVSRVSCNSRRILYH